MSLFSIVSCNWNAVGPAFFQSSYSFVEELLILLFQRAIWHADNVFSIKFAPVHGGSGPQWYGYWVLNPDSISSSTGLTIATDRSHFSDCNNRPYLHSSEMQPNNKLCHIVVTVTHYQWKFINKIYQFIKFINEISNVHLYRSKNYFECLLLCLYFSSKSIDWLDF